MSSFFTVPGAQKKRKQTGASEPPKKRINASKSSAKPSGGRAPAGGPSRSAPVKNKTKRPERDESISGSDSEDYDSDASIPEHDGSDNGGTDDDSDNEGETAAERRLRLAERYLANVRKEVEVEGDEYAFDAEQVDKDLIAERLIEDAAETKGKVYRHLAKSLQFERASHTMFRWNTDNVTSVALCAPYAYTTSKHGDLVKWKLQDLPQHQPTTTTNPNKTPVPPKRRPERLASIRAAPSKQKDRTYQGHTGGILCVAASQDGRFVVTGGADKRLVVHDATTLKPLRAFTHHRDAVTGLAFRRGTNQLYSASRDRTVKVWSLDELAYVETLFGHQDDVVDVDALAQERCVSVGARDRTARLWKVVEETQLVFRGGGGDSSSKKKKKKGSEATTSAPDTADGIHPESLAHEGCMDRVAMLDDELFVTGSDNGALSLWSIQKKKPVFVLPRAHGIDPALPLEEVSAEANPDPKVIPPPQPRWITALRTIPYSDVIVSGSWDGCVRVWRLSADKRAIEPVCALGVPASSSDEDGEGEGEGETMEVDGEAEKKKKNQKADAKGLSIKGVVNDIAMFERGDRGRDGLCVVAAVGKEHRLGRWKVVKGGRNGAMVFEVPRVPRAPANGAESSDDEEEE